MTPPFFGWAERIQTTAPKAVDPTELLERQVSDAAESMQRLDDEAWEVGVSAAAPKDAFANSTPEFTELEQALATPRHADPIPVGPSRTQSSRRCSILPPAR